MMPALTERRALGLLTVGGATCVVGASAALLGLRLCLTPSLPLGVYKARDADAVRRGDIVLACLPEPVASLAARRGYIAEGRPVGVDHVCRDGREPLGKVVLAVAGDTVSVTGSGLAVDGLPVPNTARLARDSEGRPLPMVPAGRYPVRRGQMWLVAADHRRSFDSRYFGPVPTANALSLARPVLVWPRGAWLPRFRPESTAALPHGG